VRTQEVKNFIRKYEHLFWYSLENKEETVSHELVVETILNYGNMILGMILYYFFRVASFLAMTRWGVFGGV
jgi:hypothetical protein